MTKRVAGDWVSAPCVLLLVSGAIVCGIWQRDRPMRSAADRPPPLLPSVIPPPLSAAGPIRGQANSLSRDQILGTRGRAHSVGRRLWHPTRRLSKGRAAGMSDGCALLGRAPLAEVPPAEAIRIMMVGDVSFARDIRRHARERFGTRYGWVFDKVREPLSEADLVIVNLESPLLPSGATVRSPVRRGIVLHGDAKGAAALQEAGVRVALLANNHIGDAGAVGVKTTLAVLQRHGIAAAGIDGGRAAGLRGVAAGVRLNIRGVKVAIFAFCTLSYCEAHSRRHGWGPSVLNATSMALVAAARAEVDVVAVSVHWGAEYTTEVDRTRVDLAKTLVDVGVDIVFGHHAHVPQGHTRIGAAFVAFGLSNFVFDSHVCRHPRSGELTAATMQKSPGCRRLRPNNRLRMAALTRKTRVYRVDVEPGSGAVAAAYLPCEIAAEQGPPLYRPIPSTGVW
eukprot:CAMPEP_0206321546 /NCGR_PEP_ID=MMETSP0106_2-20121207/18939_1 /ASSEMBLY_ACC=CAM_ASM_000206 /TAXON_ID=81532 /ORGANISM="Acanthoeca-like sp., Strain 10tr" /LENGTH=450 /DNA_ID=CAMNT_0053753637 /DNA_START=103 /DNA_END=1452 /DNA_ORIENTATION=-